jgi:GAF domain-containing protein
MLQSAAEGDTVSRRRLHGLFEAHRTIISDLSLSAMLDRIVVAACDLVGAQHGALAVVDSDGAVAQYIQHGMDERAVSTLGTMPPSGSLLTALLQEPCPIRTAEAFLDPAAGVFLPQGPATGAFLGVPIRVRDEIFGLLYLTETSGQVFDAEDEELLTAFAATAGTAIENARFYDDARRSRDWLNASGAIARALLADADQDTLLEVVSRALHVAEADYGSLIVPTHDGRLEVAVVIGLGADDWRQHLFDPHNSEMGEAIARGESMLIPNLIDLAADGYHNVHHYGPAMLAPLIDAKGVRGAVLLMRAAGRRRFTSKELDLAMTFADQVALAFEMNDARAHAEALRALEARHRIAQELHDNVMQRLFAIGVRLEGLASAGLPPEAVDRIQQNVADLDETIDEIRARVFDLRGGSAEPPPRSPNRFPRVPAQSPTRPPGSEPSED